MKHHNIKAGVAEMQTKLLEGIVPRIDDQLIMAMVEAQAHIEWCGTGKDRVIGLRNDSGQIYRHVVANGMGEFMHLISVLETLNLREQLLDTFGMREGCDTIFS
ncbi:MAG: hypothetical protein L0H10_08815 [Comamonas sp.]|uniref:hypothetical protein n=1 Tax=Comamonas sp. TaxID=34028 RepID=UPI00264A4AFC|nr:hypothetical protein [Comamonas sp.]MDN5503908.1 hypothetical protein [Comamonas sp.]MDN5537658.1 hypothetical protein [Comamonas sp.]